MIPGQGSSDTDNEMRRIQKLGSVARIVFPKTHTLREGAGETFYDMGFVMGLFLWAFGLLWLFFAAGSVLQALKFPFNLGWWAFTFPLGVYSTCTCQLGREMPSRFFDVLGTVRSPVGCRDPLLIFLDILRQCGFALDTSHVAHSQGHLQPNSFCGSVSRQPAGETAKKFKGKEWKY